MLAKGSEAYIYLGRFLEKKVIIKERQAKTYRHESLDSELRLERMKLEARILYTAAKNSIPVPKIIGLIPEKYYLVMEYINGKTLGSYLKTETNLNNEKEFDLFKKVGTLAGQLHSLNIIHGDLSIHNFLVKENDLVVIDFGLAQVTDEIELFATDIYTFESTLRAFSPLNVDTWFSAFLSNYRESFSDAERVLEQFSKIILRGRYVNRKDS